MSDTSQGPGWWLASDGKWYPPELWTGPPITGPTAPASPSGPPAYPAQVPGPGGPGTPSGYGYGGGYGQFPQGTTDGRIARRKTNGMAIASLVCSCAGVFLIGLPAVLGIVFGFVARAQIRHSNGAQGGAGLALAGIIVGFAVVALIVIVFALAAERNQNAGVGVVSSIIGLR